MGSLFSHIESIQGDTPWGTFLDAGTGSHSLKWVSGLPTSRWTAVTCGRGWTEKLRAEFADRMRRDDRVEEGNWTDPAFLYGEVYDVVLADYLLGAVDGFSPYFQDRLLERLRRHVGSRLYLVGLEPYPETTPDPAGRIIIEIAKLRDACILLAGDRPYREFPLDWTLECLERSGYRIEDSRSFPIIYRDEFINGQLDVCLRKLPRFPSRELASEMERSVAALRERALGVCETHRGIRFGFDYVIHATPVEDPNRPR